MKLKRKKQKKNPEVLSVTQNGIKTKNILTGEGQQSLDYSKYQNVNKKDFIMNHMDLLTGFLGISSFDGVTSPDYRVFKIKNEKEVFNEYLLNLFEALYKLKIFYGYGQGVSLYGRWRFNDENFLNFKIPLPDYNTQVLISNKINNFKDKFKKIQKALNKRIELNQDYFSTYVDEKIKQLMKKENYVEKKLKFLINIKNGNSLNIDQKNKYSKNIDNAYSFIGTENLNYKTFEINYNSKFKIPIDNDKFKKANKNSILFCLEGGSYGKKFAIINKDVCFGNKLLNIENKNYEINIKYLFFFFQSLRFKKDFYSRRVGLISGVPQDDFLEIRIPVFNKKKQEFLITDFDIFFSDFNKNSTNMTLYYKKIFKYFWNSIFQDLTHHV